MTLKRILISVVVLATLLTTAGCGLIKQAGLDPSLTDGSLSIDEILGTAMPDGATPLPPEELLDSLPALGALSNSFASQSANSGEPVCGGPDSLIITVLGIDEMEQADAIRLVRVDFVKQEVTSIAIPRDFWVKVVGFEQYEIEENRINATYGFGQYFNGKTAGIVALNENLQANFGVKGERFLVLHFSEIEEYIDIVGGVDIVLEEPVDDGKIFFEAGEQHLDGALAVRFMRVREYDSDFQRVKRQTVVLSAFFKKVISEMKAAQILKLIRRVITADPRITDLKLTEMTASICLARQIDRSKIIFEEIPSDMYHRAMTNRGASVVIPHPEAAEYIQSVINGNN